VPKSTTRKKKKSTGQGGSTSSPRYGANIGQTSSKTNVIAAVVGVLVLGGAGAWWWNSAQTKGETASVITELAEQGQGALANVRSVPSQGNGHLAPGQTRNYPEPFPTSGDHSATAANAGFYNNELPKVNLVHSMEHGNVVIYYDTPGDEAIDQLKAMTSLYDGFWDGLVVTSSPGLGEAIVLTAWTKILMLDNFDAAPVAAFVDAYRGRGPENPVR